MLKPQAHQPPPSRSTKKSFDFSGLHPEQNLTEEEVCAFVSLARSTVREKLDPESDYFDPSFPLARKTRGEAKKGEAVRWRAGDIIDWNKKLRYCVRPGK